MIHPTAIIDPSAEIAPDVEIGPYCVINANVSIDSGSVLKSHVAIDGHTRIGKNNTFFPFAAIGQLTQDMKYAGEPTALEVGDGNTFRENTTIHRGTSEEIPTRIGNDNLFLSYAHVAHDCQVGNNCILSNNATLGGHCTVYDYAIISGLSAIHQFTRIGEHCMIGGMSRIPQDIPPFMIIAGNPAAVRGVNLIGLQRRGFSEETRRALKNAYKKLFLNKSNNLATATENFLENEQAKDENVSRLIEFIQSSERGITR
ncbi:acyl-ACP--UDP-N-acetylglucosamine O-acyltransferase [Verrucomicrobiaceae bacterium N1E253]|uniref:Acyl-[acyl-carrier-protein]--UDP-N-acetylglucosamine O-acyltransferase n=1 Tax=Oceaniferula marina TaxID=2748318 RepID=A0A851GDB0_9BACT|nr:acyl-ACP--UDP-N-acetylglucosamine O-acyltransferase [Oceaniferula marina]NWK55748.1 acyl-ACP--UDP-N-acetylglucosamine O-acyltransferase [Oceaniferula marina]